MSAPLFGELPPSPSHDRSRLSFVAAWRVVRVLPMSQWNERNHWAALCWLARFIDESRARAHRHGTPLAMVDHENRASMVNAWKVGRMMRRERVAQRGPLP